MPNGRRYPVMYGPEIGCGLMLVTLCLLCVLPGFVLSTFERILEKLHLSPTLAPALLISMFFGGFVNFPLRRIERAEPQTTPHHLFHQAMGWAPRRRVTETILAVNLGGCVIPVAIAVYLLSFLAGEGGYVKGALIAAALVNVAVCYLAARPIPGVGIAMPAFAAPAAAVGAAWLLLMGGQFDDVRAPVAFVAGVLGPLVGADLLHLRDFTRVSAGMISIGGAGTFDGIVISCMLAALLA